jgi:site-specific recombinase XerD
MLEQYFTKPQTADRIKESWIGQSIEKYVVWLSYQGYAARTVHRRVPLLRRFGEVAWDLGAREIEELPDHIDSFIDTWIREHKRRSTKKRDMSSIRKDIRRPVEQFLKIVVKGYTGNSNRKRKPFSNTVPAFFSYLRDQRGLSQISIGRYFLHLGRFENYLTKISLRNLSALSPIILSSFISDISRFLGKWAMRELCCVLRVFLRYLYQERVIARDLSRTIEPPQMYRLSDIPRSISWDEVALLLETVDRRTPTGKRDYAILLLLITYGLRAREVSKLTLDDIDWKRERLYIRERKAGPSTAYPLSVSVGEAIIDYIKHGRPETPDRYLFFRAYAPRTPITHGAISTLVSHYIRKAGIQVARPGSHTLRHTCAQRLVDASFSFKLIGDYVGHRSLSSTEIYTKVDIEALRKVVCENEEGLL